MYVCILFIDFVNVTTYKFNLKTKSLSEEI